MSPKMSLFWFDWLLTNRMTNTLHILNIPIRFRRFRPADFASWRARGRQKYLMTHCNVYFQSNIHKLYTSYCHPKWAANHLLNPIIKLQQSKANSPRPATSSSADIPAWTYRKVKYLLNINTYYSAQWLACSSHLCTPQTDEDEERWTPWHFCILGRTCDEGGGRGIIIIFVVYIVVNWKGNCNFQQCITDRLKMVGT